MAEVLVAVRQTRESIQSAIEQIENCFTAVAEVGDQIERACNLLLNFTKEFGVEPSHRQEAIAQKSDAVDLQLRERRGELTKEEFRAESASLRRRVLQLTGAMATAAESHLVTVETAPGQPPGNGSSGRMAPSIVESLRRIMSGTASDGLVFSCKGLSKRYGLTSPFVISGLDLELRNREISGLVGLNGSGKTTLLRMIAGVLEATTGEWAYPALKCSATSWVTIRRSIALVPQRPDAWSGTVEEALTLQAACYGETGARGVQLVNLYIARLGLTPYRFHTWKQLSGGYRTRFELAKAMLARPKMLMLDEPLAALDIPAQMQFLTDLQDFARSFAEPMPILISSQHIYEIEAIADHMLVIRDGRVVYNGPTAKLGQGRAINGFELSCDLNVAALTQALAGHRLKTVKQIGPREMFITTENTVSAREIIEALVRANATVRHFRDTSESCRMLFDS